MTAYCWIGSILQVRGDLDWLVRYQETSAHTSVRLKTVTALVTSMLIGSSAGHGVSTI